MCMSNTKTTMDVWIWYSQIQSSIQPKNSPTIYSIEDLTISDYSAHCHDTTWPTQKNQKLQINALNFSRDMSHMKTVATNKSTSPQNVITKMLFYIQIPYPQVPINYAYLSISTNPIGPLA